MSQYNNSIFYAKQKILNKERARDNAAGIAWRCSEKVAQLSKEIREARTFLERSNTVRRSLDAYRYATRKMRRASCEYDQSCILCEDIGWRVNRDEAEYRKACMLCKEKEDLFERSKDQVTNACKKYLEDLEKYLEDLEKYLEDTTVKHLSIDLFMARLETRYANDYARYTN